MISIRRLPESDLTPALREELRTLLESCFPGCFPERPYFKQLPHQRILVRSGGTLVAQVGLDHRAVRVGDQPVRILGVVDLCCSPAARGQGVAGDLLDQVHTLAESTQIPFTLLFADDQRLYRRKGYAPVDRTVRALGIDEHRSLGVLERPLGDCMMVRENLDMAWPDGPVDLLGHTF